MASTNTVVFSINGKQYSVADPEPYYTLNQFIRSQPNLKGTKHNCGQGGCGVCMVTITYKDPGSGAMLSMPVNSCIRPLLSCHGMDITTVEGVGQIGNLHPVQQR